MEQSISVFLTVRSAAKLGKVMIEHSSLIFGVGEWTAATVHPPLHRPARKSLAARFVDPRIDLLLGLARQASRVDFASARGDPVDVVFLTLREGHGEPPFADVDARQSTNLTGMSQV